MKKAGVGIVLVGVGLLFAQFVGSVSSAQETAGKSFAQNVNLALRRTAHTLLREQGDSTSRIAPVQQIDDHTFAIRLEKTFSYDAIPALLQKSLERQQITTAYDVSVLDCTKGEVQLGYSFYDLKSPDGIACSGRIQQEGCHTLQVTFREPMATSPSGSLWWAGTLGFLLAGLSGLVWHHLARSKESSGVVSEEEGNENNLIHFGQSHFNPANQSVQVAGTLHQLTYRETKLLRLFAERPNQLLERDFILKSVWEDEGITVGRSVDVFVSRLRKFLQRDTSIRLACVHGVGYRLEIRSETA